MLAQLTFDFQKSSVGIMLKMLYNIWITINHDIAQKRVGKYENGGKGGFAGPG